MSSWKLNIPRKKRHSGQTVYYFVRRKTVWPTVVRKSNKFWLSLNTGKLSTRLHKSAVRAERLSVKFCNSAFACSKPSSTSFCILRTSSNTANNDFFVFFSTLPKRLCQFFISLFSRISAYKLLSYTFHEPVLLWVGVSNVFGAFTNVLLKYSASSSNFGDSSHLTLLSRSSSCLNDWAISSCGTNAKPIAPKSHCLRAPSSLLPCIRRPSSSAFNNKDWTTWYSGMRMWLRVNNVRQLFSAGCSESTKTVSGSLRESSSFFADSIRRSNTACRFDFSLDVMACTRGSKLSSECPWKVHKWYAQFGTTRVGPLTYQVFDENRQWTFSSVAKTTNPHLSVSCKTNCLPDNVLSYCVTIFGPATSGQSAGRKEALLRLTSRWRVWRFGNAAMASPDMPSSSSRISDPDRAKGCSTALRFKFALARCTSATLRRGPCVCSLVIRTSTFSPLIFATARPQQLFLSSHFQ